MKQQRHSIDLPFSLSLFMVFVLCAFMVLLLQINGYHSIVQAKETSDALHSPLAYLKTSIRSNDVKGNIDVFSSDGIQGLKINDTDTNSILYIYEYHHHLKELRVLASLAPDFTTGNNIFEIQSFHVEKQGNKLKLTIQDKREEKQSLILALQTE